MVREQMVYGLNAMFETLDIETLEAIYRVVSKLFNKQNSRSNKSNKNTT